MSYEGFDSDDAELAEMRQSAIAGMQLDLAFLDVMIPALQRNRERVATMLGMLSSVPLFTDEARARFEDILARHALEGEAIASLVMDWSGRGEEPTA